MRPVAVMVVSVCSVALARADDVSQLLAEARTASAVGKHEAAVRAYTAALELDPTLVAARDARGDEFLKLGKFKEAVADFDAFIAARPDRAADHWRRGIALYYAGRYADGVKQFDLHRTVNPEDVENSAWHYLCNVRARDRATARQALLPVSKDARVPMAQVLGLFAGRLRPEDVIAAADAAGLSGERLTAARFYAHFYVGLYYEGEGDGKQAREHVALAAGKYAVPGYMGDVAKVHLATMAGR